MTIRSIAVIACFCLLNVTPCRAADLTINSITPVFESSTPRFGDFSVKIEITNNIDRTIKLNLVCLYLGLTPSSVYSKNDPTVQKQYQIVEIQPLRTEEIVFKEHFRTYHPEMLGEVIVSVVGSEITKSIKLQTAFHPNSQD